MTEEATVAVPVADLLGAVRDLEEYVISLDRILSRVNFGGDPAILVSYVAERDVFRRVAHARQRLSELLEPVVGEEKMDQAAADAYVYTDP